MTGRYPIAGRRLLRPGKPPWALMLGTVFMLALRSIRRHILRSFLTILGIVIGVAAVVTMVTLGKATTLAVQNQIAKLGSNVLMIRPGQGFGRGGGGAMPQEFKSDDVAAIRHQVDGVEAVAPQTQTSATAIYDGANWSTTITGTTNSYFTVQPWTLSAGRLFSLWKSRRARRCVSSAPPCKPICSRPWTRSASACAWAK